MPAGKVKILSTSYVRPATLPFEHQPVEQIDLCGFDALLQHQNVCFSYHFTELLSTQRLKSSLARTLDDFPLLAGRARKKGEREYVVCNGKGAKVIEQVLTIAGDVNDTLEKLSSEIVRGGAHAKVNDPKAPMMTITLSEVVHVKEFYSCFSCVPECSAGDDEESRPTEVEEEGKELETGPVRFIVGICISHGVADGSSVAFFLNAWAARSCSSQQPVRLIHSRGSHPPPSEEGAPLPETLRLMTFFDRARIVSKMVFGGRGYEKTVMRFSGEELSNIKNKAMEQLQGTERWISTSNSLAAHIWPIISKVVLGEDTVDLLPFLMIINVRKHVGIPMNYFGNMAALSPVESATIHEDITGLALKVRDTCSFQGQEEQFSSGLSYLQMMMERGQLHKVFFKQWAEMLLTGRHFLAWDDVSVFKKPGQKVGLCGLEMRRMDYHMSIPMPGICLVLPGSGAEDDSSKEVMIVLTKEQAQKLRSTAIQEEIHKYHPTMIGRTMAKQTQ